MPSQPSDLIKMEESAYLEGGSAEDGVPSICPPVDEEPRLVKPEGVKSRYWVHFMRYDIQFHPDKKTTARCALCGKDISVKQGTGGLKNHLRFKHPEESALLMVEDEGPQDGVVQQSPMVQQSGARTPSRAASTALAGPAKKKPRTAPRVGENPYSEITIRMDVEKRSKEKHLMEMWSTTRCEIRDLRKELKEEEDEDIVREVEADIRILKKRKADYAEMLGFPKDDLVTTAEHTEI